MAWKRPADREVNRAPQEPAVPKPTTTLGRETRKPNASDGIDTPIPDTHGTDAPGQYGPS